MNMTESKSQLDNTVQMIEIENIEQQRSDIHMKQPSHLEVHSQNLPEVRSQNIDKLNKNLENIDYKRQLLKLMITVKLQAYGYRESQLRSIIQFEMANQENIQYIEGRDLDLRATEISLNIVASLFGEVNRDVHRLRSSSSLSRSVIGQNDRLPNPISIQQENQMHFIEQNLPEILCNICYNLSARFCEQPCGHTFCLDCMKGYIHQNQRSGNYIVKCPEYDCAELVTVDVIKTVLSPYELERFVYFKQKNEREMNPDNKFCSKYPNPYPRPDCGELLDKANDRLSCRKCDSSYCEICLQNYHDDNPCDIVLKNSLENTYRSFKIKKCPSCKSPIQKSQGCNHMTCKKCKYQFCWLCLKKYSHHHYRYYNCFGCPGMQFEEEEELVVERVKQLVLYLLMPFIFTLIFFCYISAIPIYMVGSFIYKPCYWADSEQGLMEEKLVKSCSCLGEFFSRILMWLLFQPRAVLYAVFISPIKLTMMFCGEFCKVFE